MEILRNNISIKSNECLPLLESIVDSSDMYVTIRGFPTNQFVLDIRRVWKTTRLVNLFTSSFIFFGRSKITIHKFFIPELYYIMLNLPKRYSYLVVIDALKRETWLKDIDNNYRSRVNLSKLNDMNYSLKPYQKEFLSLYDKKKQSYNLNGYLLAFEQGLGKTFTSLSLMHCLNKDVIIIIAPKNTLYSVWKQEIYKVFKEKQSVYMIGDKPKKSRFYIFNYNAMNKINEVYKYISSSDNVGIIVDESHNFRNASTKRVSELKSVSTYLKCEDILFMSGTPIKAIGSEMIPMLEIIDPLFDEDAEKIFKKVFGLSIAVALDVLKNRLGLMMYRKTKSETLQLPNKTESEIKIQIPNSQDYTIKYTKKLAMEYIKEREQYHASKMSDYNSDYSAAIDYFTHYGSYTESDFNDYLKKFKFVRKSQRKMSQYELFDIIKDVNQYENNIIIPQLPSQLKKDFVKAKSALKYVHLTILGEVLGNFLTKRRVMMYNDMIKYSPSCSIIRNAEKKTIFFTTYVAVANYLYKHLKTRCKYNPLIVTSNTPNVVSELNKFRNSVNKDPLIATVQSLSTGVTLTEANSMVFINKPWRYTDYSQASDRIHRIGQDTDVFIYNFVLDTGNDSNLSTRVDDIVNWSKNMFEGIVGAEIKDVKIDPKVLIKL